MVESKAMEKDNIYQAPDSDVVVDMRESNCVFFPTSNTKLLVLFFSTLGLYSIYWFYKHWSYQRQYMDKKINPVLRSIFCIFFTHSLFKRIKESAEENGINTTINFSALATLYVVLELISSGLDRASGKSEDIGLLDYASIAIIVLIVLPLYAVQKVANQINDDPEGNINSQLSPYNYIFIMIGTLLWALVIAAMLEFDLSYLRQYIE